MGAARQPKHAKCKAVSAVPERAELSAKAEKDKLAGEKEELESQLETIRIEKEMV